jgi:[protein-PII] uridylyltransferase
MEFDGILSEIEGLQCPADRSAFIKSIKDFDAKALDYLKNIVYEKWEPGKGARVSSMLTRLRDKVLLRVMEFVGPIPDCIDIVAVGGYGRGEMSPFSDIDILILHREDNLPADFINQFLYVLWDIGYKLGNSVRTIKNVVSHSREDITLLTSLFESRLLAGDGKLLAEMYRAITNVLNGFREEYFRTKIEDIYTIYGQVGNSVLLKEPNLKENAGGLRSVHYAEWINFAVHSVPGREGIRKHLDPADFDQLGQSYDFLLHIRNMLHFINNRKEDNLIIDYHIPIANNLGYTGGELDKVTAFMRDYYDRSMRLFLLSWSVIDSLYAEFYKKKKKAIDGKYYLIQRELFIDSGVEPSPEEAFEAVFLCASKKYRPSYNLISFIRNAGNLITPGHRQSKILFYRFVDILGLENSSEGLNLMKTSDFLYKYIPQFEKIRHYIIYNPFHKYTVDEHSIEAIRMLEGLCNPKFSDFDKGKVRELVALASIKRESMWILKIALLLHDIGKAYPGDHGKNGVEVADIVFREMPLAHRYQEIVSFLIENHLVLSNVSRRSDVYNLKTILDFSQRFNLSKYPEEYLEYLYLLTYADIVATNPTNYTGYFATLLYHIFDKSRMVLTGEMNEEQWDIMIRAKRVNIAKEFPDGRPDKILATLGEEYMNRHTEEEITEDIRTVLSLGDGETRVSVRRYNEHLLVKIFSPDELGLFGRLAGILLLNGANIVKANIYTYEKIAMDFFYVTEIFGANLSLEEMRNELDHWIERLNASIADYLPDPEKLNNRIVGLKEKIKGVPAVFKRKAEVTISGKRKGHYLITVSGSDRPALLYDLCRYLSTNRINITNALIDTIGWHIRDEFTVVSEGLTDEEVTARHETRMKEIVETNLGEI